MNILKKKAAVISTGWIGDTIACTAAATSLAEMGYQVTLFIRWPQLKPILDNDKRFNTRTYWRTYVLKLFTPILNKWFDLVVWEPCKWSYQEPFTSEIRRLAGCDATPEYSLCLSPEQLDNISFDSKTKLSRPVICISRDLYKRLYGRDAEDLISQLTKFADIQWVGLNPDQDSKQGKNKNLLDDARSIANSDLFLGPEGGILWLAAGLDKTTVYFTEHISEVEKVNGLKNLDRILGSENHFPHKTKHVALPPFCTNDVAVDTIKQTLSR
jgi:hypothetical protein